MVLRAWAASAVIVLLELSRPDGTYEITGLADRLYMVDAALAAFDIGRRHDIAVRRSAVSSVDMLCGL